MTDTWYILGAGAMGTLTAHEFSRAHVQSCLLHHGSQTELRFLQCADDEHTLSAQPLTNLDQAEIKRLLVTTKAGQLAAALRGADTYLHPDAVIVTTANGLGMEAALAPLLGSRRLVRAVSTAAAFRQGGHQVTAVTAGETAVGDGQDRPAPWFLDGLQHVRGWRWSPDIGDRIHRKFAINCAINGLTASLGCRNGELLNGPGAESLAQLVAETEPVLRALGLWKDHLSLQAEVERVCRLTADNQSSMLQDILAQRPTEMDYLNGELLRRGRATGFELARNQQLVRAVRALELKAQ